MVETKRSGRRAWLACALVLMALAAAGAVFIAGRRGRRLGPEPGKKAAPGAGVGGPRGAALGGEPDGLSANQEEPSQKEMLRVCGSCHALPPPDSFPKQAWEAEVVRGLRFFRKAGMRPKAPPLPSVLAYFLRRAPEQLSLLPEADTSANAGVRFERRGFVAPESGLVPAIANVRFVRLGEGPKLDVIACDMQNGLVLRVKPYEPQARLETISKAIANPCHVEPADLDNDGRMDLLVADLGYALPTDDLVGSVVWLRAQADGSFAAVPLADGLGRVADVQPADFDADGDLDLVVAVFGRYDVGEVLYLKNETEPGGKPKFVPAQLDKRAGTIHLPVADLNADGKPDFVALISQEHEVVVAFLNKGGGEFEKQEIYKAPNPAFGSSGIQVVDLDRDGDLDVLLTNGDALDTNMLKPYSGLHWLENRGDYPFVPHELTRLYGIHRAQAGDIDGDGDLDIIATSFLPGLFYRSLREEHRFDSLVLLEQKAPGQFVRSSLEKVACDHPTCDLGDFDGDGRLDFVTANYLFVGPGESNVAHAGADWVTVERNLGP